MILLETDATPMHIGALMIFHVKETQRTAFFPAMRTHIAQRLPHTPLLATLNQSPDGYDSDVWADITNCDLDRHIEQTTAEAPMDNAALYAFVAKRIMQRLDPTGPLFHIDVLDNLTGDRAALYVRIHHAVADGIGVMTILGLLSDSTPPATDHRETATVPDVATWRALAEAHFAQTESAAAGHASDRKAALAAIKLLSTDPSTARARTPVLKMSGPTSTRRAYTTVTLELARLKTLGHALGGTVNDIFLAIASTALRNFLVSIDDLPSDPIVINSARSYRRPEHGLFGNRIVALHPHLATDMADPLERLRAIQRAMATEQLRTPHDEAMLGAPDRPGGAADRRAKFVARSADGAAVLPGNITLSNVPGPAEHFSYAGFKQIANFPTPLLGSGRFLNITSRRNGDVLNMGIMADPDKIPDVGQIARGVVDALAMYERLATERA